MVVTDNNVDPEEKCLEDKVRYSNIRNIFCMYAVAPLLLTSYNHGTGSYFN